MDSFMEKTVFRVMKERRSDTVKAFNIKTEYLKNPLGIDMKTLVLCGTARAVCNQTAYQIVTDDWDSGKIESSSMRIVVPVKFEKAKE